jgi:DNA-binding transcriptional MerR regulator
MYLMVSCPATFFKEQCSMHYVSLTNFCHTTGLTAAEVQEYEARGFIRSTTKGDNRFYSQREAYRTKGIIYFMRAQGLTAEQAAAKIDQETTTANRK